MADTLTLEQLHAAPKVLLHDHLDGGLRPQTVIELADELGNELPTTDVDELQEWFTRGADRKDLALYLDTFEHTVGVMQTADGLHRVAKEAAEDLDDDNVVYAEVRFAPALHTAMGLSLDAVVEAVLAGFDEGSNGRDITVGTLITAMRTDQDSMDIAELAIRHRDNGAVGFDIAGREDGYPPSGHLPAFEYLQRENFHFTIHAGEAFGPRSIWEAVQFCGAERLGHGVRITDDIETDADGQPSYGRLANYVRDRRIPLEMCPSSNVHTGAAASIAEHPIGFLADQRFRVTVNTDNRLMSDCSMTSEFTLLHEHFGWGLEKFRWLTINAMKSAFWPFDERLAIIDDIIKPRYAALLRP
jgi:adenosine deaminase